MPTQTLGQMLADQLAFYLEAHLLPRLEGLTDEEYLWQPRPDAATIRPEGNGWAMDVPDPDAVGVPTIAWRLAHISAVNIGTRVSALFGTNPKLAGTTMFDPRHVQPVAGTAAEAVTQLRDLARRWNGELTARTDEQMMAPLGEVGDWFRDQPLATLALHVSRETMHHGGEVCLLRDLYATR